jgi:hypothetical protein
MAPLPQKWGTFLLRQRCFVITGGTMNRTKLFSMFFTFTFGLFVTYFGANTALGQAKNEKAPSFTLKLLNGGDFKSSDLKGKVAVLKFVSSY